MEQPRRGGPRPGRPRHGGGALPPGAPAQGTRASAPHHPSTLITVVNLAYLVGRRRGHRPARAGGRRPRGDRGRRRPNAGGRPPGLGGPSRPVASPARSARPRGRRPPARGGRHPAVAGSSAPRLSSSTTTSPPCRRARATFSRWVSPCESCQPVSPTICSSPLGMRAITRSSPSAAHTSRAARRSSSVCGQLRPISRLNAIGPSSTWFSWNWAGEHDVAVPTHRPAIRRSQAREHRGQGGLAGPGRASEHDAVAERRSSR